MEEFYFRRGKFETRNRWQSPPTFELIVNFFKDLKENTDIFDKYKVYLVGNCLYNIEKTNDVDIKILGKYDSYDSLEKDLNTIMHFGIDRNRIYTDVMWQSVEEIFPEISRSDVYARNYTEIYHENIKTTNFVKIEDGKFWKYPEQNDYYLSSEIPDLIKYLNRDLILCKGVWPWYFNEGSTGYKYKKYIHDFLVENPKMSYKADELIEISEEQFFRETNLKDSVDYTINMLIEAGIQMASEGTPIENLPRALQDKFPWARAYSFHATENVKKRL